MKLKPPPTAAQLPGDWAAQQHEPSYEANKNESALKLPPPQPRFVHPPGPGKRTDGKLWFEGPSRRGIAGDKVDMMKYSTERIRLDENDLKPRDFRKGDRWLPWHFGSETS
jgi:hypothetical protein